MPDPGPLAALETELEALLGEKKGTTAPAPKIPESPPPAPRSRTVLIIDDNEDYRSLVRSFLKDHCFETIEAQDGFAGLKLISEKNPDLVIVDFNMPKMNGYELIQEVRSAVETRKLPIIMFSGAPNRRHLKDLRLDISDFLDKPVSNSRLLEAVVKALGALPPRAAEASRVPAPAAPAPPSEKKEAEEPWPEQDDRLGMLEMEVAGKAPEECPGLESVENDSPLVNRVNKIIARAVEMKASDIHIEPQEKEIAVRVRLDGSLKSLCTLPISLHPRLAVRIKIMASLVITEHRRPQDGQFRAQIKGQKIEFRVSTLPSAYGEKIVIRILGQSKIKGDLASLEMNPRDLDCVEKTLRTPHGLILVTGPTGSGKTTTLYSMIGILNTPDVNIMTAEDPVEYRLPGITQVHVQSAIGLTFESVLRAFLRQDPDIMLVGEIRDKETAEIAIKASITGHLVLSTLHTNSAPATIIRLTHMGVAPYLVAASVKLVIAQRLVKSLCPACKFPAPLSEDEKKFLSDSEAASLKETYRGQGCERCHRTGYAGRKPIFEVMPLQSSKMRQLVSCFQSADPLADLALEEGMTSLRKAAMDAVARGETSMSEALRIIAE